MARSQSTTVLAVDLGAESGRVMAVSFDGAALRIQELHRFPNVPVTVRGTLHWDVLRLWGDIQIGLAKGAMLKPASIGVDTWGVDFVLLDARGHLLGNPVHYRDARNDGVMDRVCAQLGSGDVGAGRATIFEHSGLQFLPFNTLFQLMATPREDLERAHTLLTIPDLLNFWLSGARVCEFTNATTTQLLDPRTRAWSDPLIGALDLPRRLFPEVVESGTRLGDYNGILVIAPACHDTGSAVAGTPLRSANSAYISSGTWSLVGVETRAPVLHADVLAANITNEGGAYGTTRLLKNVMGLWIVQQCRATWERQGHVYSYGQLMSMARDSHCETLIDVDDARFLPPGDHPGRIRDYCVEHGRAAPETHADAIRCVYLSLAHAYNRVLRTLQRLTGHPIDALHIVGGGSQNTLLCDMTQQITGLPVHAGPTETTVLGNALVQLIALGELRNLAEGRALVAEMRE
jgi:rhamnulokinase